MSKSSRSDIIAIMQILWELADKETDEHTKVMLEAAGNICENSLCYGQAKQLIMSAVNNALDNG
jgi:uncharacterized protein (DUF779 family)